MMAAEPGNPPARLTPLAASALSWTVACYGAFAVFLLLEALSFLSVLDSPPPGEHATYDVTTAAYFIVDLIVCSCLAFAFLLLRLHAKNGWGLAVTCILFSAARFGLIYYLYSFTVADYHWVPYIHKVADGLGDDAVRAILLPAQVLLGLWSAWACRALAKR